MISLWNSGVNSIATIEFFYSVLWMCDFVFYYKLLLYFSYFLLFVTYNSNEVHSELAATWIQLVQNDEYCSSSFLLPPVFSLVLVSLVFTSFVLTDWQIEQMEHIERFSLEKELDVQVDNGSHWRCFFRSLSLHANEPFKFPLLFYCKLKSFNKNKYKVGMYHLLNNLDSFSLLCS